MSAVPGRRACEGRRPRPGMRPRPDAGAAHALRRRWRRRAQAMREKADAIKAARMRIFVRRGGPNWQTGLALMRTLGAETGVEIEVYGPDTSMTGICARAIAYSRELDRSASAA